MPPPASRHVVVIGGGLAGLAAAEGLVRSAGIRVTLVEPTGRLGGVLATARHDGWLVERSADSFLAARPEGRELVERLGLADQLIGIEPGVRRALVFHGGRTVPAPAGFRLLAPGRIDGILTTPLLSAAGKFRVLAERFVRCRPAADSDDEPLEHFAVRRLGREAFDRLVQPLVSGIWTADPARLSMAAACPDFFQMERRFGSLWAGERSRLRAVGGEQAAGARYGQFVTLSSGMQTLPDTLGGWLEREGVRFITAAVTELNRAGNDSGGWNVSCDRAPALEADGIVMATPAPVAANLLGGVDQPLAEALAGIDYAGSAVVSLGYARADVSHPLDAAGVVVPRSEGRRILAVSFSSSKFPGRAPAGHVLVRVFVGGALDPQAALLDDERLVAIVRHELTDVIGARAAPRLVQIDRWTRAMPQYHVGHLQRLDLIHGRLRELPGLALAGAAYEGVGIPQVIATGQEAAAHVNRLLEARLPARQEPA